MVSICQQDYVLSVWCVRHELLSQYSATSVFGCMECTTKTTEERRPLCVRNYILPMKKATNLSLFKTTILNSISDKYFKNKTDK